MMPQLSDLAAAEWWLLAGILWRIWNPLSCQRQECRCKGTLSKCDDETVKGMLCLLFKFWARRLVGNVLCTYITSGAHDSDTWLLKASLIAFLKDAEKQTLDC